MEIVQNTDWDQSVIGKILADDIFSEAGHFLLRGGTVLSSWHLTILRNHDVKEIPLKAPDCEPVNIQLKHIFQHKDVIYEHYEKNVTEIKAVFQQAVSREVPELQTFMEPFIPLLEKVLKGPDIFLELRHMKGHDDYTYRHSINVGLLAATIGKILGFPYYDTLKLGTMGLLHDIGKMKVSRRILNKPGELTPREFEEVKKHAVYGDEILKNMEGIYGELSEGVLYHHERLDGSGYPKGLKGAEIPFLTQIVAVADVYDAVSSDRVYRHKYEPFETLQELVKEVYAGRLNGKIVFPFTDHILQGYIGKKVVLNNGSEGEIISLNRDEIQRPVIRIEEDFIDLRKIRDLEISEVLIPENSYSYKT